MICEHLSPVEAALIAQGVRETFRGKPWSLKCREWVYYDCYLDLDVVRQHFTLPGCVIDHIHRGTHDGQERGLVCSECDDAIVGAYEPVPGMVVFKG